MRLVLDTNVLVSRLLAPRSVPGQVVRHAVDHGRILVSDATLTELADVLSRAKFDAYLSIADRQGFVERLGHIAERVSIRRPVAVCRDADDDRILEVAVNGGADFIVSGDGDLLGIGVFEKIPILAPAGYWARFAVER